MTEDILSSISKEVRKEYVEVKVFDCKSCGRKGLERSNGIKHEEECISKSVVFIGEKKTKQAEKGNVDSQKFEKLLVLYFDVTFLIFPDVI